MEKCKYDRELCLLLKTVQKHEEAINGNGQKGLRILVAEIGVKLDNDIEDKKELQQNIKDLTTAVSGLLKFQTETEVQIRVEEKTKADKRIRIKNKQWLVGTAIMLITYLLDKFLI